MVIRILSAILGVAIYLAPVSQVQAQDFPTKPIEVVVPFPPGALDIFIRFMQPDMTKTLGQPLIIENKTGANGYLGTEFVSKAKPDGYTLLFSVTSSVVMGPLTSADVRFNIQKDFTPVAGVMIAPLALVVRNSLPINNMAEFVAYAKANPGKMNFGSPGAGSVPHIVGERLSDLLGTKEFIHVPYRGYAPAVQALIGNELDFIFLAVGTAAPFLKAGQMKAVAVDAGKIPELPDLPDLSKTLPGFETLAIFGAIWAPAGTPKPIVNKLSEAALRSLKVPDVRSKIELGGQIMFDVGPDEVQAETARSVATANRLVERAKATGVKFD